MICADVLHSSLRHWYSPPVEIFLQSLIKLGEPSKLQLGHRLLLALAVVVCADLVRRGHHAIVPMRMSSNFCFETCVRALCEIDQRVSEGVRELQIYVRARKDCAIIMRWQCRGECSFSRRCGDDNP